VDSELARMEFRWLRAGRADLLHDDATYAVVDWRLSKKTSAGQVAWTVELPKGSDTAVLAMVDKRLVVVVHNRISTGAAVLGFAPDTGRQIWTTRPRGLGPIGHSQYLNEVSLEARGKLAVLMGKESAGKYVVALEAATGKVRTERTW